MSTGPAIWQMPFRPFFVAAAVFALAAVPVWLLSFLEGWRIGNVSLYWHTHEMLFGFAATVVVGFVLTAVQTWTGIETVKGIGLKALVACWCLGRVGWLLPAPLFWIGAAGDVLLFSGAAAVMSKLVVGSKNWRNVFFVPVLLLFALFSASFAYALLQEDYAYASAAQNLAFFLLVHIVLVVGGRVIPFFSDRRLGREATVRFKLLEVSALASNLLFLLVLALTGSGNLLQVVAAAVALLNFLRWLSWKPWQTRKIPLLWSLHLAYGFLILGFAWMAFEGAGSIPVHLIAVGGISFMILAMISRVSLGHSGRPMELPGVFVVAYLAIIASALIRATANLSVENYGLLLWLAAAGWTLGFGLFVFYYLPILLSPRPDGRPG